MAEEPKTRLGRLGNRMLTAGTTDSGACACKSQGLKYWGQQLSCFSTRLGSWKPEAKSLISSITVS
jgi:hypothetical protein